MSARAFKPTAFVFYLLLSGIFSVCFYHRCAAQGLTLYTPFTEIFVPPGESVDYPVDVINKGTTEKTENIMVTGLPKGWTYQLKSGSMDVGQVSVLPGEKKNFALQVEVPLSVNKKDYHFHVLAGGLASLPLTVAVSQQGTYKSELSTDQANMEGAANATFTFSAKLRNSTAASQVYALRAMAPPGWEVSFKAPYKQVSSLSVEANHTQQMTISINPPDETEAGTYRIPVVASTSSASANLMLEVHITGSYAVELTTASGLLSTDITAGDEKQMEFVLKNTGSAELNNITLRSAAPLNWTVSFNPEKIDKLEPGQTVQVVTSIKADRNAIAGDYVTNLEAYAPGASSKAALRVSVKTPLLLSWAGILIIFACFAGVFYLFRKYGRR